MTAISIVLQKDRAHIISDGAVVNTGSGILEMLHHKVTPLPHLNAAVAGRGHPNVIGFLLTAIIGPAHSYDALLSNSAPRLRATIKSQRSALEQKLGSQYFEAEIYVAGWSEIYRATARVPNLHVWS